MKDIMLTQIFSRLDEQILRTLLYYDIFNYPLRTDEVVRFLGIKGSEPVIASRLSLLRDQQTVFQFGELFSLKNNDASAKRRIKGNTEAGKFLLLAKKKAKLIIDPLPVIEAVPGQMRQIFQNMITNALKFTREEVIPVISISATRIDALKFDAAESADGNFYRLSIKDNGIGFDPQYVNKIFTIFQRLHSREKYEGTGIGLAIAKKIIEKHNGIITAKSTEGEGAEFIMVLPRKQPENH